MANTYFLAEKKKDVNSFCIIKATHIFAAKISMYLKATTSYEFFINEFFKLTKI